MKMFKKLAAVALAAVLALTVLAGCGGSSAVPVDIQKSKEILNVINERRREGGMQELVLSEEASMLLGDWAKAAAVDIGADAARDSAKAKIKKLTIDGKPVTLGSTYTFDTDSAEGVEAALKRYTDWFIHNGEETKNYVAIASYSQNGKKSVVVIMLRV